MSFWSFLFLTCMVVRHVSGMARSCKQLKNEMQMESSGIYTLRTEHGMEYQTYCDMVTDGGGWTLVASVHENFMLGRCTVGDRWTTQQGNSRNTKGGDLNWINYRSFGTAQGATSDDFKSPAYYDIIAENMQVWHVPNLAESPTWSETAILKYHTANNFLTNHGGNLFNLFTTHTLTQGETLSQTDTAQTCTVAHGPSYQIVYQEGSREMNNASVRAFYGPWADEEYHPGWIQFRPVNNEGAAMAMCSGVRACGCNVEHFCIGGGGYFPEATKQCGDFSSMDNDGYGVGKKMECNQGIYRGCRDPLRSLIFLKPQRPMASNRLYKIHMKYYLMHCIINIVFTVCAY